MPATLSTSPRAHYGITAVETGWRVERGGGGGAGGGGAGGGEGVDGPVPGRRAAGGTRRDGAQPQRGRARVRRGRGHPFPPPQPPPAGPLRARSTSERF